MEELRELKTRSFRDRKVLWHRIDQELKKSDAGDAETEKILEKQEPGKEAHFANEDVDQLSEIETNLVSSDAEDPVSGANKWKNSRIKVDKGNDWLFQFDDEEYRQNSEDDDDDHSFNDFDVEIDPTAADDYDDANDYRPPEFHMAASLPVNIPNLLARNIQPPKKNVAASPPLEKKSERKPFVVRFLFIFFYYFLILF